MKCANISCDFWSNNSCLKQSDLYINERGECKTYCNKNFNIEEYLKRENLQLQQDLKELLK